MAKRKGRCLKRKNGRCLKRAKTRRSGKRRAHRKPAGMARKGSVCKGFKRVRVRGGGIQRRCRKYGR